VTNAESFKRLEEVVQSILNVVPEKEFFGVLVGNKNDLSADRVSYYFDYNQAKYFC